jgi:serine/threonine protein kinase
VHGEIKPENISVDSKGDIKITDLKLFKKLKANDDDELPYYDSPEIIKKYEEKS